MRRSTDRQPRAGVAIVIALVALVLAGVFLTAAVRNAVGEYRQLRGFERQSQAIWLAASGIQRARARLAVDPAYAGETWNLPANQWNASRDARVVIEVSAAPNHANAILITARADYPCDLADRSRETKQLVLEAPQPGATR